MNDVSPACAIPIPVSDRVAELRALYDAPDYAVADRLCDAHDPAATAYRIIGADGSASTITYGELTRDSERFAAALASLGIGAGDRVATLMGKGRRYLVALVGIWRLGAVHVPLFTAFAPPAIAFRLTRSGAKVVLCDGGQRAKLAAADMPSPAPWRIVTTGAADDGALAFDALMAAAVPGRPAAVLGGDAPIIHIFTSGTTGKPKGVVVPARALASFRAYAEFALDLRPSDLYWCAADPGWAYGLYYGILVSLVTGTQSVLQEGGFVAETMLDVIAAQGVTNLAAAPTIYRSLRAASGGRAVTLRCASSAGEPLTPDVNDWAVGALGVAIHDHYGQTETGMLINTHHHPLLHRPMKPGSMGVAMPGWRAAILAEAADVPVAAGQVGRVAMDLAHSPLAWFAGYSGDAEKTAEKFSADGRWYLTGDIGMMDADGDFHFSSRDDDVIIMAGYRIGPFEVESVLVTHPAVAEAAVIAVPDAIRGEVMESCIVLAAGTVASPALATEIQQWVKTRYAAHAYPRAVHFVDALPKTPSGKVQRFVLRQQRRAALAAASAPHAG